MLAGCKHSESDSDTESGFSSLKKEEIYVEYINSSFQPLVTYYFEENVRKLEGASILKVFEEYLKIHVC